jgi:hypothetical protein
MQKWLRNANFCVLPVYKKGKKKWFCHLHLWEQNIVQVWGEGCRFNDKRPPFWFPRAGGNFQGLTGKTPTWGVELIIELDCTVYVWVTNRQGRYK